ncbi:hypothetical protein DMB66_32240 [Actinoplanes sp. ATCC 53533]|uniref:hypothetical protein n=1 Tax=Actinoplanes sp. ATCC 53533 TaxID=1288362 RepID=UPI000F7A6C2B|nr:hypothetical protein [Actinoplanes sp. ATCC 53533]RSM57711.1 hypothetical protein DMB66_32240 [Actinoplanes sp. ATCC 53533]
MDDARRIVAGIEALQQAADRRRPIGQRAGRREFAVPDGARRGDNRAMSTGQRAGRRELAISDGARRGDNGAMSDDLDRVGTLAQILATLFVALAVEERSVGFLRDQHRLVVSAVLLPPYLALLADVFALVENDVTLFGLPSRVLFLANLVACGLTIAVLLTAMVTSLRRGAGAGNGASPR